MERSCAFRTRVLLTQHLHLLETKSQLLLGGFKYFLIFTLLLGEYDPIWLAHLFFRWVGKNPPTIHYESWNHGWFYGNATFHDSSLWVRTQKSRSLFCSRPKSLNKQLGVPKHLLVLPWQMRRQHWRRKASTSPKVQGLTWTNWMMLG